MHEVDVETVAGQEQRGEREPGRSRLRLVEGGEPLGRRLRRLRLGRSLSLRALALRLGCNHSLVVRWERGDREPSPHDLARLTRILGTTPDALLDGATLGCGRVASSRSHGRTARERLGHRIATARRRAGLGPWDVYVKTGIDGRRLRAIESGVDSSLAELRALADVLRSSISGLLVNPDPHPGSTKGSETDTRPTRSMAQNWAADADPTRAPHETDPDDDRHLRLG